MNTPYQGQADDRRYPGLNAEITYSAARCIHAEVCVKQLSSVFDSRRRPWIAPDAAPPDAAVAVISQCPSGALHITRSDGAGEATPTKNQASLWTDGPLQIRGDLTLQGANVALEHETRVTLCRCGLSAHKPFCDNSHRQHFHAADDASTVLAAHNESVPNEPVALVADGRLTLHPTPNGPIQVTGTLQITTADQRIVYAAGAEGETWLCRCGASNHKPFCDGAHTTIQFQAE